MRYTLLLYCILISIHQSVEFKRPLELLLDYDCRSWPHGEVLVQRKTNIRWDSWRRELKEDPENWYGNSRKYVELDRDISYEEMDDMDTECPLGLLQLLVMRMLICWVREYGRFAPNTIKYNNNKESCYHRNLLIMLHLLDEAEKEEGGINHKYISKVKEVHGIISGYNAFDFRILMGTDWPIFPFLFSMEYSFPFNTEDKGMNCEIEGIDYSIDWTSFRILLNDFGEDWIVNVRNYTHDPRFSYDSPDIATPLFSECPIGYTVVSLIRCIVCALTESSCVHRHSPKIQKLIRYFPPHVLASTKWPLLILIEMLRTQTKRHSFWLDFTRNEIHGLWGHIDNNTNKIIEQSNQSIAFSDALKVFSLIPRGSIVLMSMGYGVSFTRYIRNFIFRIKYVGVQNFVFFALDEEARVQCIHTNYAYCVKGTPSILNKFTLPLIFIHAGYDVFWIDMDVFLFKNPIPYIKEYPSFDILISDSFSTRCICSGVVYFRSNTRTENLLRALIEWMYAHTYEHDQKAFSAFLNAGEEIAPRHMIPIGNDYGHIPRPSWGFLEGSNHFVTARHVRDTGWTGSIDNIVIFHFLHGDSDIAPGVNITAAASSTVSYINMMHEFYEGPISDEWQKDPLSEFINKGRKIRELLLLSYLLERPKEEERYICKGSIPEEEMGEPKWT